MSEFTEEIPGQIAGGIKRLGNGEYTSYSIYPLPPDAAYDETIYPHEWIQTTGVAPDRITVEIRRLDTDGKYRVYTVGHSHAAEESEETEPISNGDNTYRVRPAEVLTATEAIDLFQHYYDHHTVPAGWHLREQAEFTIPAESTADKPAARIAETPTAPGAAAKARTTTKQEGAARQKPQHRTKSGSKQRTEEPH